MTKSELIFKKWEYSMELSSILGSIQSEQTRARAWELQAEIKKVDDALDLLAKPKKIKEEE